MTKELVEVVQADRQVAIDFLDALGFRQSVTKISEGAARVHVPTQGVELKRRHLDHVVELEDKMATAL